MDQIKLRKATQDDCDDIFRWRNDEETRKASFHSDLIPYEVHREWFSKSLHNANRWIYIAENEMGQKIGVVRLDKRNEQVAEFDVNLTPEMRGKSYGAWMIAEACRLFADENNCLMFIARAKESNPASVKAFKKAGFFEIFDYVDARGGNNNSFSQTFRKLEVWQ